ncbi:leucine-rich repeat extensin-like protein 1 [Phacochoerus africanus]|uniref:leucine-rich repeat extensin-like protein 1 n=1 Tax=Phacochoerus africanus TaxID=41426 RepID=UPI001FDA4B74|nr:leucine-rich repeat extensin-like protein 1 [Phacochoerus africanus]
MTSTLSHNGIKERQKAAHRTRHFPAENHAEEAALSRRCSASSSPSVSPPPGPAQLSAPSLRPVLPLLPRTSCLFALHLPQSPVPQTTPTPPYLMCRPSPASDQFFPFPPPCLVTSTLACAPAPPTTCLTCSPLLPHRSLDPCPSSPPCFFPHLHGLWAQVSLPGSR